MRPVRQGLYDPAFEHDACGFAFVAQLDGLPTHATISSALDALERLEHRGAAGADADTGDGAGIAIQIPDAFFRSQLGDRLPEAGRYGVAVCFLWANAIEAHVYKLRQVLRGAGATARIETRRGIGYRLVGLDHA